MNTTVITFDPAGIGRCLFTEAIDLASLGRLGDRPGLNDRVQQCCPVMGGEGHGRCAAIQPPLAPSLP